MKLSCVRNELEIRSKHLLLWSMHLGSKKQCKFYAQTFLTGVPFELAAANFVGKQHTIQGFRDAMRFVKHRDLALWAREAHTYVSDGEETKGAEERKLQAYLHALQYTQQYLEMALHFCRC